jgi:hypothetical protein
VPDLCWVSAFTAFAGAVLLR